MTDSGVLGQGIVHTRENLGLRENTKAYLKRIKNEDVLTPFREKELAFTIKYNGRHEPTRRHSSHRRAES